jgi:hypothetical protein
MILTNSGVLKLMQRIKSFITSQLNTKAASVHTHTSSDITDLPNGYVVDSTLDGTSSNAISNSAVSNALDGKIPKAGGAVITGTNIGRADNTGGLDICGGTTFENGGFVALHGKNTNVTGQEGAVVIGTNNGSSSCNLTLLPNGTATWGNKEIDTIEEQGAGYIRYSNGLQICWGTITWQSACTTAWGSLYYTAPVHESYAKSFIEMPSFSASGDVGGHSAILDSNVGTKTTTPNVWLCLASGIDAVSQCIVSYTAVGRWK